VASFQKRKKSRSFATSRGAAIAGAYRVFVTGNNSPNDRAEAGSEAERRAKTNSFFIVSSGICMLI
jgi:hypothetical protein